MSQGNIYTLEVKFSNGAYGIIVTPQLFPNEIPNWVYYMGIRKYRVRELNGERIKTDWNDVDIDMDEDGKEYLKLGDGFFLRGLARIWKVPVRK